MALSRSPGSGFRVQGSGFRVQGSGFRVQGSGFRVQSSSTVVSFTTTTLSLMMRATSSRNFVLVTNHSRPAVLAALLAWSAASSSRWKSDSISAFDRPSVR